MPDKPSDSPADNARPTSPPGAWRWYLASVVSLLAVAAIATGLW